MFAHNDDATKANCSPGGSMDAMYSNWLTVGQHRKRGQSLMSATAVRARATCVHPILLTQADVALAIKLTGCRLQTLGMLTQQQQQQQGGRADEDET